MKAADWVVQDNPGFDQEQWTTVYFEHLEVGDLFRSRNYGQETFVVLSAGTEKTEGYATPVLSRWVSRAVYDLRPDQLRYLREPEDFRTSARESVVVRCDRTLKIWTGPTPGPQDYKPHLDQITDCHCDLCNEVVYALSSPAVDGGSGNRPHRIACRILLDALTLGTHVRRENSYWVEICKARHAESVAGGGPERGYYKVSMRDFYATGMGIGMTPGGVGGSTYRRGTTNDEQA